MDKGKADPAYQINRAEFQEVVNQVLIRLLDDPQIKDC